MPANAESMVVLRAELTEKERRYGHEKDSSLFGSSGGSNFNRRGSWSSRTNVLKLNDNDGDGDSDGNDYQHFGIARLPGQSSHDIVYHDNFFVRIFRCEHDNVFVRMLGSEYVQNLHSDQLSSHGLHTVHKLREIYVQREQFSDDDTVFGEIEGRTNMARPE